MVVRIVCLLAVSLVMLLGAAPVKADWLCEFCYSIVRDTKRRNCWPKPFVCPDRYAARAPFALMVNNGWRYQNMLGDHYFSDGNELTEAGRMKVQWIIFQAPEQHRTIYVYRGASPEVAAKRIDSVQQLAAQLVPQGPLPPVLQSDVPAAAWSAARVDMIGRKFESTTPDPVLPAVKSGDSGS